MRISGMTNMYSFLNTSAARRSGTMQNSSRTGQTTKNIRTYGLNQAYGTNPLYGPNRTYSSSRGYGAAGSYAQQAAAKADAIFEGTKNAAQSLRVRGQNLMDGGKDGLLAQAEAKGDTKEYVSEVTNFVADYNAMVQNMKSSGGTMNDLYAGQLQDNYGSFREDLAKVGITAGKDGSLIIDKEALGKADIADLKKVFGSTESFAGKTSVKSIYVEANAVSEQAKNQYASYGRLSGYGAYGSYGYGGYGSYGSYGGYGGYGGYSPYSSYSSYGNYSALGSLIKSGIYGSGYGSSSLAGALFNSFF